ncbi:MAG: alpha/beta hydrolase [Spirochaetia bacterium]|jgi:pimeloyl-ACP methyl ester carboxylesterase|nr:alpha/beta hydrolase [Spirochaetia bacterium]
MFVKLEQADVYTEIIGSGKPLLMIHGNWCDHRLMSGCMERIFTAKTADGIADKWKRIYFDLPGMGSTLLKKEISTTDDILDIVDAFVRAVIKEEPFYIASESYGSYIAQGIVNKYPDQVAGIMMLCPVIVPLHEDRDLPFKNIIFRDDDFYSTLSNNEQDTCDNMLTIQSRENWERYVNEVRCGVRKADIALLKKIKRYGYPLHENADALKTPFKKPSLIITGRQDTAVGYKDALPLLENYPRADFVILDSAGHMLQIEQADIFEDLVLNWLSKL